jgi:hypothetical protein
MNERISRKGVRAFVHVRVQLLDIAGQAASARAVGGSTCPLQARVIGAEGRAFMNSSRRASRRRPSASSWWEDLIPADPRDIRLYVETGRLLASADGGGSGTSGEPAGDLETGEWLETWRRVISPIAMPAPPNRRHHQSHKPVSESRGGMCFQRLRDLVTFGGPSSAETSRRSSRRRTSPRSCGRASSRC